MLLQPATAPRQALWKRALIWPIRALIFALTWGLGFAFLLTGAVLWHDWHGLAARGIDAAGRVEHCERKSTAGMKSRGSSGYFSCTYTYRAKPDGPVYSGYFQSSSRWEDGRPIPIRYLPERHSSSATAKDLEHPSITTGAMLALGIAWLGWFARQARRERAGTAG